MAPARVLLSTIVAVGVLGAVLAGERAWLRPRGRPAAEATAGESLPSALAHEPFRPVAGRISGGFAYAPWSGARPSAFSADTRIALAHFEERAHDNHARGIARLLTGRTDEAIRLLEAAAGEQPSAPVQADLAAAYLERAQHPGHFDDLIRALTAADEALRQDARFPEALFNAALAARELALPHESRGFRDRLAGLERTAWLGELDAPTSHRVPRDRQRDREHVEDELLPDWGRAVLRGDQARAGALLDECDRLAADLAASGETMPLDAVRDIRKTSGDQARRQAFARAFVRYGEARQALARVDLARASTVMSAAARDFRTAGSLYALWDPVFAAISDRMAARVPAALAQLDAVVKDGVPAGYLHLRGRLWWTRAVSHESSGAIEAARLEYLEAIDAFARGQQQGHLAAMHTMLAETLGELGDYAGAWQHEAEALRAWQQVGGSTRPDIILVVGALLAEFQNLPRASVHFLNELIGYLDREHDPPRMAEAYLHRATSRLATADTSGAARDLTAAEQAAARVPDTGYRARLMAEIAAAPAQSSDSEDALRGSSAALEYFRRGGFRLRTVELLTARARAEERLGRVDAAEHDLADAIREFERERAQFDTAEHKAAAFARGRAAYVEMIRTEAIIRGRPDRALAFLERSATGAPVDAADMKMRRRQLPPDTGVLLMVQLDDRLLLWLLTATGADYVERPITRAFAEKAIEAFRDAIAAGRTGAALRSASQPLYDAVFAGIIDHAPNASRLAIVADGAWFGVPFAALQGPSGRYLLDDYTVEMASGLGSVLNVPRHLRVESVTAIGDGHTPSAALPYLPQADSEAAGVAALYPHGRAFPGREASRTQVLQAFGTTDVLHFAGHSVANLEHPQYAYLLTGADPGDPAGGAVYADDLYRHSFASTAVVVLASCETAIGTPVFGEGPMSLAKPFLSGGAKFVVASLWRVDDGAATAFALGFHRQLRNTGDPVAALRDAQLRMRQSRDAATNAPRAWAAFSGYSGAERAPSRGIVR